MQENISRDWKISTAYYSLYFSLYALLIRIGRKCEIHSCTIEFAKRFLNKHFSKEDFDLIDKAFSARIDSQYYVNREVPDMNYQLIIKKAPSFLVKCKNIIIEQKETLEIREKIKIDRSQNINAERTLKQTFGTLKLKKSTDEILKEFK